MDRKTTTTFRTHAPFLVAGRWTWHTFDSAHGNKHAAIHEYAKTIGATAWDYGQADHDLRSESRH